VATPRSLSISVIDLSLRAIRNRFIILPVSPLQCNRPQPASNPQHDLKLARSGA